VLESGVVVGTEGGRATVKMERHSACAECGLCHKLAHSPREMVLTARNTAGAVVGDAVRISVPDINVVTASFWAYGVPSLGAVLGGVLGWWLFAHFGWSSEAGAAFVGLGSMVAAFGLVSRYDRNLRRGWRGPEVVAVLPRDEYGGGLGAY